AIFSFKPNLTNYSSVNSGTSNRLQDHNNNQHKLMTLSLDEFLRRFLLHLLPKGFVRIRHFGFLANRRRATLLPLCFQVLNAVQPSQTEPEASPGWLCPNCGGKMVIIERLAAAQSPTPLSTLSRWSRRMI